MTSAFRRSIDRLDRFACRVENVVNLSAGLLIFALMLFGVCQIVLRTVFQAPIFGYIDIVELSMIGFAVLPIAYMQRLGGHVRMELLLMAMHGRILWLAELAGTLLAGFIVAVLIPYSYDHFQRAFSFGDSTIDIELAIWPAKLVVPVALSLLLIRLGIQAIGFARLVVFPNAHPRWVPQLKNRADIAAEEIELSASTSKTPKP